MSIELGTVGAVVHPDEGRPFVEEATELEVMGYPTLWLTGGPLSGLGRIADVMRATTTAKVASAIIAVDLYEPAEVAALHAELDAAHPGRFVVGLGGAHGPEPLATLTAYLDRLDDAGVPASSRILAALGPRMLDLARQRAAGALPVLVNPDYTAWARERLGGDAALVIEQIVVVEPDPDKARAIARVPLGFLGALPQYQANFRRIGFTDDEIATVADRLVDEVVAWGDADDVAARIDEHRQAGADHVAISVMAGVPGAELDGWWQLAQRLIPGAGR